MKPILVSPRISLQVHHLQSLVLILMLSLASSSFADPAADFQKANALYQKQQYDSAAKIYEQLISAGNASGDVYYNLGNCY